MSVSAVESVEAEPEISLPARIAPRLLHELFEAQVLDRPQHPAIIFGDVRLDYRSLDRQSSDLAQRLMGRGIGRGGLVGIHMGRSHLPIVAIIAVLKSGAGYVPIDPACPPQRVVSIAREAALALLLVDAATESACSAIAPCPTLRVDGLEFIHEPDGTDAGENAFDADGLFDADRAANGESSLVDGAAGAGSPSPGTPGEGRDIDASDIAYVIFTSGSTGRPKGVVIEHRNVVAYVRAATRAYGIEHDDRVYQGFSLAFDASVEEVWLALANGATLVIAPAEVVTCPQSAQRLIEEQAITVFSTTPTFLSMIESSLAGVRLLILGGEVCPDSLARRFAGGRRMINTYGPTEATVVSTFGVCGPDRPVTIGKPLPGWRVAVVDAQLHDVAAGESGELLIGGVGVARGYLNADEARARRFVEHPRLGRAYRSGDRVRMAADGEIHFLGREDGQVKIRGFRVELGEIETMLLQQRGVRAAAVAVDMTHDHAALAAYIVADVFAGNIDRLAIAADLRRRLPDYMVPQYLDVVDALPMTSSGKVDRPRLPAPRMPLAQPPMTSTVPPRTPLERQLAAVWRGVLQCGAVSLDDDFFLDLGGHSLLAARVVTKLRSECGLSMSVRDLYASPTVRSLAANLLPPLAMQVTNFYANDTASAADDARHAPGADRFEAGENSPIGENAPSSPIQNPKSKIQNSLPHIISRHTISPAEHQFVAQARWRRALCYAAQAISLLLLSGIFILPLLAAFRIWSAFAGGHLSTVLMVLAMAAIVVGAYPFVLAMSIAAKWLIVGRYCSGAVPLWGRDYFRWWLVTRLGSMCGVDLLAGTPWMPLYYRLMGARIGQRCIINTARCWAFDLIAVGDDTCIGSETHLLGCRVEHGQVRFGSVKIGARCFVGTHSALGLDVEMRDEAKLDDLSLLPDGQMIGAGEARAGSPARPARVALSAARAPRISTAAAAGVLLMHALVVAGYILCLSLGTLPAVALAVLLAREQHAAWLPLLASPLIGVALVLGLVAAIAAAKWLVLGRAAPGIVPVSSALYARKCFVDLLLGFSRMFLLPVYATLYTPPFLRLLGARIGRRCEVSTVAHINPDLFQAGDESFLADGALVGGMRIHRGVAQLGVNRIGRRTFIGNSAVLPVGASVGDDSLIGCLSTPPPRTPPDGSNWLGSPAFLLPVRQAAAHFDDAVIFRPSRSLVMQRLACDAFRILFPATLAVLQMELLAWFALSWHGRFITLIPAGAAVGLALELAGALAVVALKWLLLGRFKPVVVPLWCRYVWANEIINGAYESIAAPALAAMTGTPFLAVFLRLLGCRIGKGAYLGSTLLSEFDLVEIGDCAALNLGATLQTHLFEDRVMKSSYLRLGRGSTVGNMAIVLYDTSLGDGTQLAPLSLVMKGESLDGAHTCVGIPTA